MARVLMLIPTLKLIGGAQDQLKLLSNELTKLDFQHDVKGLDSFVGVTSRGSGLFAPCVYIAQAVVWHARVVFLLLQWGRKYEVIHLHGLGFPLFILGLLARISTLRVIVKIPRSGAGSYIQALSMPGVRRIFFLLFCAKVCTFIALTKDAKFDLQNAGVEGSRIIHMPNGVRIPEVSFNKNLQTVRLVFAGRLIERKNLRDVIWASYALFIEGIKGFEVVIIGDGPDRSSLEELVQELGLGHNIRFLGEVSNARVLSEFDRASIFILPSKSEGMSNSLLQACARSCAPVLSDIPQHREFFENGHNCMLFSCVEGLVDQLRDLLLSRRFGEVGRSARNKICAECDISVLARRYIDIYSEGKAQESLSVKGK